MAASNRTKKLFGVLSFIGAVGGLAGLAANIMQMFKPDVAPLPPEHAAEIKRICAEEMSKKK